MVQDESRHTEAWLKLIGQIGGEGERDPHLDTLGHMFLEADTLEEKVFLMQVFFERLIIPRFRLIARSSRGRSSRTSATGSRGVRTRPSRSGSSPIAMRISRTAFSIRAMSTPSGRGSSVAHVISPSIGPSYSAMNGRLR